MAGRPTKYDPEKHIEETRKLSILGINEEDIAWYFGVHPNTFANWKKEHEELLFALKEGQSHKKISLMKAMFENATKKFNAAIQIFLAKNWMGMTDRQEVDHTGIIKHTMTMEAFRESKEKYDKEREGELGFSIN